MQSICAYEPDQFDSLPAFDQAQHNLGSQRNNLEKFGRIIHKHNLSEKVWLCSIDISTCGTMKES